MIYVQLLLKRAIGWLNRKNQLITGTQKGTQATGKYRGDY